VRAVVFNLNGHLVRKARKEKEPGARQDKRHPRYWLGLLFVLSQPSDVKQDTKARPDGTCVLVCVSRNTKKNYEKSVCSGGFKNW